MYDHIDDFDDDCAPEEGFDSLSVAEKEDLMDEFYAGDDYYDKIDKFETEDTNQPEEEHSGLFDDEEPNIDEGKLMGMATAFADEMVAMKMSENGSNTNIIKGPINSRHSTTKFGIPKRGFEKYVDEICRGVRPIFPK